MILHDEKLLASMYIGIDISKEKFDICQMLADGKVQGTFQITPDYNGFTELIKSIPSNEDPLFVMESTGSHSGNLINFLNERGFKWNLSNPFEISRLREAFSYKMKNDVIDAWVIAQAARMNILKYSSKEFEYIYLQDILERYYDLKDRKTALLNQLHANLVETFPEIDMVFNDISSNASIAILTQYQSAKQIVSASTKDIKKLVLEFNGRITEKKLQKLKKLSSESVAWKTGKVHQQILMSQVRELCIIKEEIELVLNLMDEYIENTFPVERQLIRSIPGIGDLTASYMIAVMGDHERFDPNNDGKGAKRFSSFVGYGLKEYSSGPIHRKSGLTKRGNSKLRGLLYMASFTAIKVDPNIKKIYAKKKKNSNGKKAMVSISHLLLRRAYGVLKSGKMYNPAIPLAG